MADRNFTDATAYVKITKDGAYTKGDDLDVMRMMYACVLHLVKVGFDPAFLSQMVLSLLQMAKEDTDG